VTVLTNPSEFDYSFIWLGEAHYRLLRLVSRVSSPEGSVVEVILIPCRKIYLSKSTLFLNHVGYAPVHDPNLSEPFHMSLRGVLDNESLELTLGERLKGIA